jgi:fucose 4-O-acetylase-like acetyltransferase
MPGALSLTLVHDTPKRDEAIDVARGIAIVLVVLGHNRALSSAWPALISAIFLFHVPLFFLLSGCVLRPEHPWRAAPKLAARLLVPFALAALLVGAAKCITRGESPIETLSGILWATGQTLPWSHLWFLPTLFLALLATHAVAPLTVQKAGRWGLAIALAAIVSMALPKPTGSWAGTGFPAPVGWPWSLDLLPLCLLFVWMGQWLRSSPEARSAALHPTTVIIAATVFAIVMRIARVDLNLRMFAPFAAALSAALAGCLVTLKASQWLTRVGHLAGLLALAGRHTMVIFILHVSVQKALLGAFPGGPVAGVSLGILGLASAAATLAITLWISVLLDHLRARRAGTQSVAPSGAR